MPEPIPPKVRAAVLRDVKTGKLSRGQISRNHGISTFSVSKIAKDAGITNPFSRERTKNATEAIAVDNKALRVALARQLILDAERFRQRAWSKYKTYERGPDGPVQVEHDLPPAREQQALMTSLGIATQRHMELEKFDRDGSGENEKSMLGTLFDELREIRDARPAE